MSTYLRLTGANSDAAVLTIKQCGAGRTVGTNVNEIVDIIDINSRTAGRAPIGWTLTGLL